MTIPPATLEIGYNYWRQEIARKRDVRDGLVFGYGHDKTAFAAWEHQLYEAFLTCSPEQRKYLRDLVSDSQILWLLNGYPLLVAKEIRSSAEKHKAMLGLVALIIVDGREEERETAHSFRTLSAACGRAAISFKEIVLEASTMALSEATRCWLVGRVSNR